MDLRTTFKTKMLQYKKTPELVDSWATVDKIFRSGKQGITGVLKTRTSPSQRFVFKVSQYMNFLIEHEYKIMSRLSSLSSYCPHFCEEPEMLMCLTDSKLKKYKSPFDIVGSKPLYKPVLIEEYIKGPKLGSFIDSSKSLAVVLSAIKQVMIGILIAHDIKFTHYDLHTDNIILNTCSRNDVFLYILDDNTFYMVPTNGYCPKVIDYGFSYLDVVNNDSLTTSFLHTDIGYTNDRFDWITDAKLFLVSVKYQLENAYERSPEVKKLANCINNMFGKMDLDWECGWDDFEGGSLVDNLIEMLETQCRASSFLFSKHACDSIEVIQGLITLPLEPIAYDDICDAYSMFIREFAKIEEMIENPAHLFYILKAIVDSARLIKEEYLDKDTRKEAVKKFKEIVLDVVSSIAKFCTLKSVHYEKLLCGLYSFADCMNGYYYSGMNKRYTEKKRVYKYLPIKNMKEIVDVLYYNLQDKYEFNSNTVINVFDKTRKSSFKFKLTKENIKMLEDTEYWMMSSVLAKMYNKAIGDEKDFDSQSDWCGE